MTNLCIHGLPLHRPICPPCWELAYALRLVDTKEPPKRQWTDPAAEDQRNARFLRERNKILTERLNTAEWHADAIAATIREATCGYARCGVDMTCRIHRAIADYDVYRAHHHREQT